MKVFLEFATARSPVTSWQVLPGEACGNQVAVTGRKVCEGTEGWREMRVEKVRGRASLFRSTSKRISGLMARIGKITVCNAN